MPESTLVAKHYTHGSLVDAISRGIQAIGKTADTVDIDDLGPVDEFHIRGDVATKELIKLSNFTPDMHILDVGCGVGGSTRRLSHETGCCVTGIDLTWTTNATTRCADHLFPLRNPTR